jgi:hypothetical protein
MIVVWVGLRLFRFLTLRRLLDQYVAVRPIRNAGMPDPSPIASVSWAVLVVAGRFPWATCLVRALAADAMLRRRHLASAVRFGVRAARDNDAGIEGHAWVEGEGGATIGGGEDEPGFKVLQ